MKLPLWLYRWLHRRRLSRGRIRGTWLHARLGDRLLDRSLWIPEAGSLARAWLVGLPLALMPFMPVQALLACVLALLVRGNLLLCIALQFVSSPLTAPVHLPACYVVGEALRGHAPTAVWRNLADDPGRLLSSEAVGSLYLGALVLGATIGMAGFLSLRAFGPGAKQRPRRSPSRVATLPVSR